MSNTAQLKSNYAVYLYKQYGDAEGQVVCAFYACNDSMAKVVAGAYVRAACARNKRILKDMFRMRRV